jgi:hypothetical protein
LIIPAFREQQGRFVNVVSDSFGLHDQFTQKGENLEFENGVQSMVLVVQSLREPGFLCVPRRTAVGWSRIFNEQGLEVVYKIRDRFDIRTLKYEISSALGLRSNFDLPSTNIPPMHPPSLFDYPLMTDPWPSS